MPSSLDDYEVLETIGTGSYGVCKKIRRKKDGRLLVWKELDYGTMTETEKQLLVSEVNLLRELRHQYIVRYYDRIIDRTTTTLYIIMEYCEGGDLAAYIAGVKKRGSHVEEELVWRVCLQVVHALKECHSRQRNGKAVLHRDLKPANVFLDAELNVKLGDFGLARVLNHDNSFAQTYVGTPYYMSPEQLNLSLYNEKSDIWSLGCVLYELCALRPPFTAPALRELTAKISHGRTARIPYRYSEELSTFISELLQVQESTRPSISDLLSHRCLVSRGHMLSVDRSHCDATSHSTPQQQLGSSGDEGYASRVSSLRKREEGLREREKDVRDRERRIRQREKDVTAREKAVTLREKILHDQRLKMDTVISPQKDMAPPTPTPSAESMKEQTSCDRQAPGSTSVHCPALREIQPNTVRQSLSKKSCLSAKPPLTPVSSVERSTRKLLTQMSLSGAEGRTSTPVPRPMEVSLRPGRASKSRSRTRRRVHMCETLIEGSSPRTPRTPRPSDSPRTVVTSDTPTRKHVSFRLATGDKENLYTVNTQDSTPLTHHISAPHSAKRQLLLQPSPSGGPTPSPRGVGKLSRTRSNEFTTGRQAGPTSAGGYRRAGSAFSVLGIR